MKVYPVIMCGGSGTRLWPASRPSRPKQFLALTGRSSLFQQTVERAQGLGGLERVVVVAGQSQGAWLTGQLAGLGVEADVLLEPEGRDSAAAIAVAAHHVAKSDPEAVLVVLASDHHIPDGDGFRESVGRAVTAAASGRLVTLGIRPAGPSEAYGYIRPAGDAGGGGMVSDVARFVEKPDRATAEAYLADGYLWNSGNFIAGAATLLEEFEAHAPDVSHGAGAALDGARRAMHGLVLGAAFAQIPKISFDRAVMEHTRRAAVMRAEFAWSDLGAWDAIHAVSPLDEGGNAVSGDAVLVDATNSLVRVADGRFAAVAGVEGLAVVVEEDVVLVSRLDRSQGVKDVVEALRRQGRAEIDRPVPVLDIRSLAERMTRWLHASALPLWWSVGYDHERAMWRESLTPSGEPSGEDRRARVQGRQTWVYATAGRFGADGWAGPWQAAVTAGTRAIALYAGEDGLLRTLMSARGEVLDDAVKLYDQTFVLLALAAARDVVEGAETEALAMLDRIEERFAHERGFREQGAHPFQSNAHMHLFEAALAWVEAGGDPRWRALAQSIAGLAMERFIDERGFLREFFSDAWEPAPGEDGEVVEPGHQFEWAWLLARWSRASGEPSYSQTGHLAAARRLFDAGLKGVDAARAAAVDRMDTALRPTTDRARLWHQTEWLKAALILHDMSELAGLHGTGSPAGPHGSDRQRYHEEASRAAGTLQLFLATDPAGLWHDKLTGDGTFAREPSPASSLYHIVSAVAQLRESAGMEG